MDFCFSKIKEEIATANSISKTNLWLYLFTCKPYQLLLFLITCDIIFLHKIRQFDSFKLCWVFFYQITMAYSLCKLKICIYVYTVDINFIFVYCYSRTVFLVLTDCFGVHWSIEKFARTDDNSFGYFDTFSPFIIITSSLGKDPLTVDVTWYDVRSLSSMFEPPKKAFYEWLV